MHDAAARNYDGGKTVRAPEFDALTEPGRRVVSLQLQATRIRELMGWLSHFCLPTLRRLAT